MLTMGKTIHRAGIVVVVCALVLGVFSMSTQAKTSQYHFHQTIDRHLSVCTKMSEDRGQRQVVAHCLYQAIAVAPVLGIVEIQPSRAPDAPEPRLISFFHAFLYRPPPTAI